MIDLDSQEWRLNNIYRIISKDSQSIRFRLNHVQAETLYGLHQRNIILKARQLGMSTFCVLYLLDSCLNKDNLSAGIVSYSVEHAQHIFKKIIGHAIDNMHPDLKPTVLSRSAREICFSNGSSIRVDTSLRGGSYPLILVSEFGKTCARNPLKAEEVVTGTLQTVPIYGKVLIESTAEGSDGFFAEMVNSASRGENEVSSPLEYKLFFFPWFDEPNYHLTQKITYEVQLTDYFNKLEVDLGVKISLEQRYWYALQKKTLGDKIKQEYPSTVTEAFQSTSDAFYFAESVQKAYTENRCISNALYDALLPVYIAMDIGVNDLTVMVFFQLCHGEIRVIDYYEDCNKGLDFYAHFLLQDKKYLYHTIFLPHDSVKRDPLDTSNSYERDFKRLFSGTNTRFVVLPKMDKQQQIAQGKIKMSRCVFNVSKCKKYLDQLAKYRKKWNEATSRYLEDPLHNIACFVGDTLIETDDGHKRIDEIKVGNNVVTPSGLKTVLEVFSYKTKNLIKVKQGENELTCTPHHKLFTNKGLVTADSLRYVDHIIEKEEENIWKTISFLGKEKNLGFKDYFLSMNQKQLSDLMDTHTRKTNLGIGLVVRRVLKDLEHCTEQFGLIITEKYLKSMIYTILTAINQTIQSKISRLFIIPITCECICPPMKEEKCLESMWEKQSKPQKSGIVLKRALSGIVNTEKNALQQKNPFQRNVSIANRFINLFKHFQNTVDLVVYQIIGANQGRMTSLENAKCASISLHAIDMQQKKHVLKSVLLCMDTEKEVYDLTVEDDHCYFANGFLVSNSNYSDCHMYMCQAVSHLESASNLGGALEKHRQVVANRHKIII